VEVGAAEVAEVLVLVLVVVVVGVVVEVELVVGGGESAEGVVVTDAQQTTGIKTIARNQANNRRGHTDWCSRGKRWRWCLGDGRRGRRRNRGRRDRGRRGRVSEYQLIALIATDHQADSFHLQHARTRTRW
jgi:hypothetical protein